MEEQKNSIDIAIENCTTIINDYRKKTWVLLGLIFIVIFSFLTIVGLSIYRKYYYFGGKNVTYSIIDNTNYFTNKIKEIKNINKQEYDTLITKAISYQKLLNDRNKGENEFRKDTLTQEKSDYNNYILYGIFIILFSVLTSFYRFFLKEITKQEHYLIGFHRIRIAGNNSTTKYDDEVKIALTNNAFNYGNSTSNSKEKNFESPIPGHPTSDITTTLLNKIMDKLEFKK